ncbi:DUF1015 domain-containing protein [Rhodohalobacter sp. SW132]|uniref:DUF1015 domain-containing protein n=1 Tax=Rhodohalobacter sp. SW132 TaxID=2293433 RepID=UPI000E264ECE|nr:DUF1015 family protein [Rhodohalobacter sp. SW132]REL24699.1 DUF1015 domain-containing protein [Rhodohalobacter sp. SW132]
MATIQPFKGWLPKPKKVGQVACPPYDVISTKEAAALAKDKPNSFLHVIRPEIDLPEGTPYHDDAVYQKGAANLKQLLNSELYTQDEKPSIYIYQLQDDTHTQTGVFTCASVQDYDNDVILKHELTRPDKENDRTKHIQMQQAHAEPVMLTYKDSEDVAFQVEKTVATSPPFIEHTDDRGVIHRIWKEFTTVDFVKAFSKVDHFYIADGHHRCKSASRVSQNLRERDQSFPGEAEYDYFPVVLFPMSQMKILPYNRVIIHALKNQAEHLFDKFDAVKTKKKSPDKKGNVSVYFDGDWWTFTLPESDENDTVSNLDAALLQRYILGPVFDIHNPRTNNNIEFVGGIRGTEELERLVDSKEADLAISMYPTSIEELVDVSDAGELMPPKSTWFEPKLQSGIIIHTF